MVHSTCALYLLAKRKSSSVHWITPRSIRGRAPIFPATNNVEIIPAELRMLPILERLDLSFNLQPKDPTLLRSFDGVAKAYCPTFAVLRL